jgi:hypothetical protein
VTIASATQASAGPRTRAQRVTQASTNPRQDLLPALIVGQGHTQRLLLQPQRATAWRVLQIRTPRQGVAAAYVTQAIQDLETLPARLARLVNPKAPRDLMYALTAALVRTQQHPRLLSAPIVRQTQILWLDPLTASALR